jgi:iron complex outermembrane receptor protein
LLRAGLWLENSDTDRHTYDLDWTLNLPNPKSTAPKSISYEQQSSWKQYQPFVEFEWASTAVDRYAGPEICTLPAQAGRCRESGHALADNGRADLHHHLAFLTANYAISKEWAAYGQIARGFLVPDLSMFYVNNPTLNTPKPQTSTNYQLGTVHQSGNLTLDADLYYIDFNNKIASSGSGNDQIYYNQGGVVYKGLEGAITYYLGSGVSLHANGSLNKAEAGTAACRWPRCPSRPRRWVCCTSVTACTAR